MERVGPLLNTKQATIRLRGIPMDLGCWLEIDARYDDPLAATRPHIELYVRWWQEVRHYRPSTMSRRMSVVAGFYRTYVIDAVLEHSPAEYVRRPNVPPESPTLGLTHLGTVIERSRRRGAGRSLVQEQIRHHSRPVPRSRGGTEGHCGSVLGLMTKILR